MNGEDQIQVKANNPLNKYKNRSKSQKITDFMRWFHSVENEKPKMKGFKPITELNKLPISYCQRAKERMPKLFDGFNIGSFKTEEEEKEAEDKMRLEALKQESAKIQELQRQQKQQLLLQQQQEARKVGGSAYDEYDDADTIATFQRQTKMSNSAYKARPLHKAEQFIQRVKEAKEKKAHEADQ